MRRRRNMVRKKRTTGGLLWAGLLFLLLGPGMTGRAHAAPSLVVIVIAPEAFHDQEFKTVRSALQRSKARVLIASTLAVEAKGMEGTVVSVDYALESLKPENLDGLILIGGSGAKPYLWFNSELKRLLIGVNKLGRPIGAISVAPPALAAAGLLSGRRASVLGTSENNKIFMRFRAIPSGQDLTVDGNLITARSWASAEALAKAVLSRLPAASRAQSINTAARPSPVARPTLELPDRSNLPNADPGKRKKEASPRPTPSKASPKAKPTAELPDDGNLRKPRP